MSRRITKTITNFSGGITDNIRTSDLTKCAHVSHFDIYRDPSRLYPMPGYIDDMNDGSTATGMKQYTIKAFGYDGTLYAIGKKSGGTDCKLFEKATPTTASWTATTGGEGTYELYDGTYLRAGLASRPMWVTTDSSSTWVSSYSGGAVTDNTAEIINAASTDSTGDQKMVVEFAVNAEYYGTKRDNNLDLLDQSSVTADVKTTGIEVSDIQTGDAYLGIFGWRRYPHNAQMLLWDTASALVDQNVNFGKGKGVALGHVNGTWVGIVDENLTDYDSIFLEESNGRPSLAIKYVSGGSAIPLIRMYAATNTNAVLKPTRGSYLGAMLFEATIPQDVTPTTYKRGIWAVGKSGDNPLAVSLLLDSDTLGTIEGYHTLGTHHFFAHAGDGSISRLDDFTTGTYDITCVYETLMFGYDTPYTKQFNGIAVTTEDLPASATVTAKYRFDENDSWTTLGTSSTDGDEHHVFTKAGGSPIGEFQEIQFRIEVLGNAPVKGIHISYTETDSLPFTL